MINKELKKNKDKIKAYKSEKVICSCGCSVRKDCLKDHQQTKNYINCMNKLSQD
jgi:hypothetical protein